MPDPTPSSIHAGMIDMESNTTLVQSFPAHEAVPDGGGPFPAVVVLHDRFGLNAHTRNVANRLARVGYYVLAPDVYASPSRFSAASDASHPPSATSFEYSDETAARDRAATLADERSLAICRQALTYLAGRSKARSGGAGVLGFGTGGRLALLAACSLQEDVRSAVCFHPDGLTLARPGGAGRTAPIALLEALAAPILIFYGRLDTEIRPDERDAVRRILTVARKDFHIEVFPSAGHDFFCEERDTYRIGASKAAWDETLAFFRRLAGGQTA